MNGINDQRRPEERIQETRLVRGEETAYEFNAYSNGSQSSRCDISSPKYEQIGSDRNDAPRENAQFSITNGGEDTGKISERLKLIEKSFLSYVRNHQQRLEANLDESRALEERFLKSVKELERDIEALTSNQKSTPKILEVNKDE